MDSSDAIQLLILVVLLALSAFFSSSETALTTVNKIRMRTLADAGDGRAEFVMKVISNPGKMLSAILIGNNIVNLYASSLSTMLATRLWGNEAVGFATGGADIAYPCIRRDYAEDGFHNISREHRSFALQKLYIL